MKSTAYGTMAIIGVLTGLKPGFAGTFDDLWRARIERDPATVSEPATYGVASMYTDRLTATGERFHPYERDPGRYTCASPTLPMGTVVVVIRGDRWRQCRINDVGPAGYLGRVIDLPVTMAADLGISEADGLGKVTVRVLKK